VAAGVVGLVIWPVWFGMEFVEFQPLSGPEVTREDQMLHALEYIAQALSGLMRERVAQHGVLALEGTRHQLWLSR
jgi:hypothetical protein